MIQLTHSLPKVTTRQTLTLSGRVLHGTALRINGREVTLSDGEFSETVDLKPGSNGIRLEARDAVKNLTIVETETVLDQQAPSLRKVALSKKKAEGVLKKLGMSPTEAIRLFYRQICLRGGLPFRVLLPNELTRKTLEESGKGNGVQSFESLEEMFESWER